MQTERIIEREQPAGRAYPEAGERSFTGLAAIVAALTMLFAALSSAYLVRRGLSTGWTPVDLPGVLWISPLALILGSVLLQRTRGPANRIWVVGLAIFAMLAIAESCRELNSRGATAASSAAAAFFFVFGAMFAACLIAGCIALLRSRASRVPVLYWHFLTLLWVWLLLILKVLP